MLKKSFAISVSLAALLAAAPAQAAVDAEAFAAALVEQFKNNGIAIAIGSSESDGDDVILRDITGTVDGDDSPPIGELVLQDVEETDYGYRVGVIEIEGFSFTQDGVTLDFGGASFSGLSVPNGNNEDPIRNTLLMEGAEVSAVKASDPSGDIFNMDGATMTMSPYTPGLALSFVMSVDGLKGDMTKLPDAQARGVMAALGYPSLTGSIQMAGSWAPTDGRMILSEYRFTADDAASLNITFDISGYTAQVVKAMQDLQKKQATGEVTEEAMGLAMLGILQQLTFHGMAIRLDDASLTNKVLDFLAAQQGVQRGDLINQAKGILPFMLAQLQNPGFAAKITQAAGTYLDNPGSLTIKSAPAAPIPAAQLMAAGMTAPQSLPDVMAVEVTAND